MTQEQTARAWTGIFKRSTAPSSAAVATPAAAPEHAITSKVFPRFLTVLAQRETPAILDLGPVVGPNIAFFGERLACKIYVEDVLADIEDHASPRRAPHCPRFSDRAFDSRLHRSTACSAGMPSIFSSRRPAPCSRRVWSGSCVRAACSTAVSAPRR